jgi:hypothetical protein
MDLLWANVFLRLPICLLVARPSDLEQHRNNNIKIAQAATFAGDIPLTRPVVGQFRQSHTIWLNFDDAPLTINKPAMSSIVASPAALSHSLSLRHRSGDPQANQANGQQCSAIGKAAHEVSSGVRRAQ